MRPLIASVGLLAAAMLGCRDSTAPPSPLTSIYVLEDIAGRPLPTIEFSGGGDTTTVVWEVLTLDGRGHAVSVRRQRHVYLSYPPEEETLTLPNGYRLTGDTISVGYFGPCADACRSNEVGTVRDSSLTLWPDISAPSPFVFHYRLVSRR